MAINLINKYERHVEALEALKSTTKNDKNRIKYNTQINLYKGIIIDLKIVYGEATGCHHNWKEYEDGNCNAQMRCTRCKEIKETD